MMWMLNPEYNTNDANEVALCEKSVVDAMLWRM
jgi:hypothetical protein